MTICNLAIEMAAATGMVAPDDKTFEFMATREFRPRAEYWDQALAYWRTIPERRRRRLRSRRNHRHVAPGAAGHLGRQPGARHRDRRPYSRSGPGPGRQTRGVSRRARLHAAEARRADCRDPDRRSVHRLLLREPDQRSSPGGAGGQGAQSGSQRARLGRSRARGRSSARPRPRVSTGSSRRPGSTGASLAAPSATVRTAISSPKASARRPTPIATTSGARASTRSRIWSARQWRRRRQLPGESSTSAG